MKQRDEKVVLVMPVLAISGAVTAKTRLQGLDMYKLFAVI